jgi:hypothetical protein
MKSSIAAANTVTANSHLFQYDPANKERGRAISKPTNIGAGFNANTAGMYGAANHTNTGHAHAAIATKPAITAKDLRVIGHAPSAAWFRWCALFDGAT